MELALIHEVRPVLFPVLMAVFCAGLLAYEWRRTKHSQTAKVWHPARGPAGPQLTDDDKGAVHNALREGRWKNVLQAMTSSLPEPGDARAPYHLGLAYEHLGAWRQAEACYHAALAADPEHRDSAYNLARLMAASGRTTDAIAAYKRLLDRQPRDVDALFNQGHLYFTLKLYPQAYQAWKAAKLAAPQDVDVQANLRLLARMRRVEQARAA